MAMLLRSDFEEDRENRVADLGLGVDRRQAPAEDRSEDHAEDCRGFHAEDCREDRAEDCRKDLGGALKKERKLCQHKTTDQPL